MNAARPHRPRRRLVTPALAALSLLTVLTAACSDQPADTTNPADSGGAAGTEPSTTTTEDDGPIIVSEPALDGGYTRLIATKAEDAPPVALIETIRPQASTRGEYFEPLTYVRAVLASDLASQFLADAFNEHPDTGTLVSLFGRGSGTFYYVEALPESAAQPSSADDGCAETDLTAIDPTGKVLHLLSSSICGLRNTLVTVQWTGDHFYIADDRYHEIPTGPSPPGVIALDHPGHYHLPPGRQLELDLTELPITHRTPDPPFYPDQRPLPPQMCVDITITAGTGDALPPWLPWPIEGLPEPRPQVIPNIALTRNGEPIPLTEPDLELGGPRQLSQDEHLTVTWPYGPIPLDTQPTHLTVTATQGEIIDWGASIRHC